MKFNALLKDLLQNGVLGTAVADIHVVEWQQQGCRTVTF
jgi:small ligand-binding sensory domain FIST